jgi:hypothetical protein
MLPAGRLGTRNSRVDRQQRRTRHGVLQPGPRGKAERLHSRWKALVKRTDAPAEAEYLGS